MPPTQETSSPATSGLGTISLIAIALLLIGGVAAVVYLYAPSKITNTSSDMSDLTTLQSLVTQGDYARAAQEAANIASKTSDADAKAKAERLESYSRFMSGLTEEQVKAVGTTMKTYQADVQSGDIRRQARDISRMLEYVTASRDQAVFDAVFSGPFATYEVEGDLGASLTALANYSMSLTPTTIAAFTSTAEYLYPLSNFDKVYTLTASEKKEAVQKLLPLIDRAKSTYATETRIPGYNDVMGPARYNYWLGIIYGAMATVDSQYLDESEAAFQEIFNYYDTARDANGAPYALVESRLPMADYAWANTIFKVTGTTRKDDIAMHLDRLIARVSAKPENFENQFLPLIRKMVLGTAMSQKESFLALADVHKPFADFLESYGLTR